MLTTHATNRSRRVARATSIVVSAGSVIGNCIAIIHRAVIPHLRIRHGIAICSHGRGRSMVHRAILRNIKVFINGESCHDIDAKKRCEKIYFKKSWVRYGKQDKQRKQAAFYDQAVACKPIKSLCGDFQILKKLFGFKVRLFGTIQIKQAIQHNGHGRQGHESPYNIPIHIYGYDQKKREGHNTRNPSQDMATWIILKRIHDLMKYFLNKCKYHGSFPCKFYLILPFLQHSQKQKGLVL